MFSSFRSVVFNSFLQMITDKVIVTQKFTDNMEKTHGIETAVALWNQFEAR